MALSISTAIVKPVDGLCNLSCLYCYTSGLGSHTSNDHMRPETLQATIDFFCKGQENVEFIWHGGEPLLAGMGFYRQIVKFQLPWLQKGVTISNFVQTNGTLVNSQWAEFFAKNDFLVGASLDGPQYFHDKTRRYTVEKGSFNEVMRGIDLLKQFHVFNGIICGVTTENVQFPEQLFDFFMRENIKKLKFARIKNLGHSGDVSGLVVSPEQYYDFMSAIFDLWLEFDDPEVEIRDIQSVVNLLLGGTQRECIYLGQCDQFATVYKDGSIFSCDSFPRAKDFHFGNVFEKPTLVRKNIRLQKFQSTLGKRRTICKSCNWYFICKGGCAKDCHSDIGTAETKNKTCEHLKRYFSNISSKLKSFGIIKPKTSNQ